MNTGTVQRTNVRVVATYECGDCGYTCRITGRRDVLHDGIDCQFRPPLADMHGYVCTGIMVLRVARAPDRDGSKMTL